MHHLFQASSTIAAAVAGGIALVIWCLLFAILIFKKSKGNKKETSSDLNKTEQQIDAESEGYDPNEKPSLYELQIPDSPGPVVKPKKWSFT